MSASWRRDQLGVKPGESDSAKMLGLVILISLAEAAGILWLLVR